MSNKKEDFTEYALEDCINLFLLYYEESLDDEYSLKKVLDEGKPYDKALRDNFNLKRKGYK